MVPPSPQVHVVDDDVAVRRSLDRLLRSRGYDVRGYASAEDFLCAARPAPEGCIVVDLRMPGADGLELQEALARCAPDLPVIFFTGQGDLAAGVRAMKAGAVDFLEKPSDPDTLLAAVSQAIHRGVRLRQERADREAVARRFATLTEREREVLREILAGRLNKQIAGSLGIVERTVKVHRARIMAKTGAKSLAELVRIAAQLGRA